MTRACRHVTRACYTTRRVSCRDAAVFSLVVALGQANQGTNLGARGKAARCQLDHRGVLVDRLTGAAAVAFKLRMKLHPGQFPAVHLAATPADQGEILARDYHVASPTHAQHPIKKSGFRQTPCAPMDRDYPKRIEKFSPATDERVLAVAAGGVEPLRSGRWI